MRASYWLLGLCLFFVLSPSVVQVEQTLKAFFSRANHNLCIFFICDYLFYL